MPLQINKIPPRVVIYPRDIENIAGVKTATARLWLRRFRLKLKKEPGTLITIQEFCECTGLKEDLVREFIQ